MYSTTNRCSICQNFEKFTTALIITASKLLPVLRKNVKVTEETSDGFARRLRRDALSRVYNLRGNCI